MTAMETITEEEGWSGHWPFQARVLIWLKNKQTNKKDSEEMVGVQGEKKSAISSSGILTGLY